MTGQRCDASAESGPRDAELLDQSRLRRLLELGSSLFGDLDLDTVLRRVLAAAVELVDARYAALGVVDGSGERLERFLTVGLDEDQRREIGELPRGHGVLGVLIREPRPLRVADVGAHPQSYGFPLGHPPMGSFLGVPIVIADEVFGSLYLTEKVGAQQFAAEDEQVAGALAEWAAIAIDNARRHGGLRGERDQLTRRVRAFETTRRSARRSPGKRSLERILELVVKRGRALVQARAMVLALPEAPQPAAHRSGALVDGDAFVIAAAAGEGVAGLIGTRVPIEDPLAGSAPRTGRAERFNEVLPDSFAARLLGAREAIVSPMRFRNRTVGVLVVADRLVGGGAFGEDDERLLQAFASTAAIAVATAQTASNEALRRSIQASEAERGRWARELHDETLQQLAGLRVRLSGARRSGDPAQIATAVDDAIDGLSGGIAELRVLITDLRPVALDELGAKAALETLTARVAQHSGLEIELAVELGDAPERHVSEIEATTYRLVQEGLNNVVQHAQAQHAEVRVTDTGGTLEVMLRDDGRGFRAPPGRRRRR